MSEPKANLHPAQRIWLKLRPAVFPAGIFIKSKAYWRMRRMLRELKKSEVMTDITYLPVDCPNCGRQRLQTDGSRIVCEKCHWNPGTGQYERDELRGLIVDERIEAEDHGYRKWYFSKKEGPEP